MNGIWTSAGTWLLQTAVGGGLVLLFTWWVIQRLKQPAQRQRLAEFGVAAGLVLALLNLGPSWLPLPQDLPFAAYNAPLPADKQDVAQLPVDAEVAPLEPVMALSPFSQDPANEQPLIPPTSKTPAVSGSPASETVPTPSWLTIELLTQILVAVFFIGASWFLMRWIIGHVTLWRLLRDSETAPESARSLLAKMLGTKRRLPRLLVSRRLRVPISCGLFRPTVVLPANLVLADKQQTLRWVFTHELTHLERHDAWSCWLFGLGQIVFFYLPWFWSLRRQVRLCQEYVADATVAEHEDGAADYAEFLLRLSRKSALPAGATSVLGNSSDLFRRVTMLLQDPLRVRKTCSRLWSLAAAGGLFSLAILLSGVSLALDPNAAAAEEGQVVKEIRIILIGPEKAKTATDKPVHAKVILDPFAKSKTTKTVQDKNVRVIVVGQPGKQDLFHKTDDGKKIRIIVVGQPLSKTPIKGNAKDVEWEWKVVPGKKIIMGDDKIGPRFILGGEKSAVEIEALLKALKDRGSKAATGEATKKLMLILEKLRLDAGKPLQPQPVLKEVFLRLDSLQMDDLQKEISRAMDQIRAQQAKIESLRKLMEDRRKQLLEKKRQSPARLGVSLAKPSSALADQLNLPKGTGLVIQSVLTGTAAEKAGLKVNDILLAINDSTVTDDPGTFAKIVSSLKPNGTVVLVVLRKGQKHVFKAVLLPADVIRKIDGFLIPPRDQKKGAYLLRTGPDGARYYEWKALGDLAKLPYVGKNVVTTVIRDNEKFTTKHQDGNLAITVTGTVIQGKLLGIAVKIIDGKQTLKFANLEKVPAKYLVQVKRLIELSMKTNAETGLSKP